MSTTAVHRMQNNERSVKVQVPICWYLWALAIYTRSGLFQLTYLLYFRVDILKE